MLDLRYVLGVVNSQYIANLYNRLVKETGRVFPQVKLTHVKKLPLVIAPKEDQSEIADLVDRIVSAKRSDPDADTSKLEAEIDHLVYKLYGLTQDEIDIVESASK